MLMSTHPVPIQPMWVFITLQRGRFQKIHFKKILTMIVALVMLSSMSIATAQDKVIMVMVSKFTVIAVNKTPVVIPGFFCSRAQYPAVRYKSFRKPLEIPIS
jgi:hypothetical protein